MESRFLFGRREPKELTIIRAASKKFGRRRDSDEKEKEAEAGSVLQGTEHVRSNQRGIHSPAEGIFLMEMEMLLHFMVSVFLIVPGFIAIGILALNAFAAMLHSKWLAALGQIFCPMNEVRELRFSESFDNMYAEDLFFGDGGIDNSSEA